MRITKNKKNTQNEKKFAQPGSKEVSKDEGKAGIRKAIFAGIKGYHSLRKSGSGEREFSGKEIRSVTGENDPTPTEEQISYGSKIETPEFNELRGFSSAYRIRTGDLCLERAAS